MAKQDVLDAINATIVENNQKGITAQALNNILTLMVENAGEGSGGSGALNIICSATEDIVGYTYELTEEEKAHNAEVYSKCLECCNNGTTIPLIVADFSPALSAAMGSKVSRVDGPKSIIFTPFEMQGLVGLLIETTTNMMVHVSEDGSVTVM